MIIRSVISQILWFNPLFVALLLACLISRSRRFLAARKLRPEDVFPLSGLFIYAVSTFIGGDSFGFPRYMVPALPLFCVFIAMESSHLLLPFAGRRVFAAACVVAAGCLIQTFIMGDINYYARFVVRDALAFSRPLLPIVEIITIKIFLSIFAFTVLYALVHKRFHTACKPVLLLIAIGACAGQSALYGRAGYST